jgi:glycosyltransferase involved in cell wall biosynthesis
LSSRLSDDSLLLIDVTRLIWRRWVGRQPTGIDRVCLAYVEHFGPVAQAVVQHPRTRKILDRESSSVLFELLTHPGGHFRRDLVRAAVRLAPRRGARGGGRIYLNAGHTGLNDEGFVTWVKRANVRPVYFVHDLIPIMHPEFCRTGERDKHLQRMRSVLSTAAGVITNSQATLDDLSAFATSENMPSPTGIAAFLGSDALPPSGSAPEAGRCTFVILGTIEARKNHLMLLHVWSRIVQQMGHSAPRLLVIGQRGWECDQVFNLLSRSELLKGAVTEINQCNDASLAGYLRQARALLFPSLVEGYGLPLVEALRCNTPVIASDLPVFREIAGDVPEYLDPLDGPAWQRAVLNYSDVGSITRCSQIRRIGRYQPPTWQDHFEAVDSWLTTL